MVGYCYRWQCNDLRALKQVKPQVTTTTGCCKFYTSKGELCRTMMIFISDIYIAKSPLGVTKRYIYCLEKNIPGIESISPISSLLQIIVLQFTTNSNVRYTLTGPPYLIIRNFSIANPHCPKYKSIFIFSLPLL